MICKSLKEDFTTFVFWVCAVSQILFGITTSWLLSTLMVKLKVRLTAELWRTYGLESLCKEKCMETKVVSASIKMIEIEIRVGCKALPDMAIIETWVLSPAVSINCPLHHFVFLKQ